MHYSLDCGVDTSYIGDGYCDDDANTKECQWDGGDCCGEKEFDNLYYCTVCECKWEQMTTTTAATTPTTTTAPNTTTTTTNVTTTGPGTKCIKPSFDK